MEMFTEKSLETYEYVKEKIHLKTLQTKFKKNDISLLEPEMKLLAINDIYRDIVKNQVRDLLSDSKGCNRITNNFKRNGIDFGKLPMIVYYDEEKKKYIIFDGHHRIVVFKYHLELKNIVVIKIKNPWKTKGLNESIIKDIQNNLNETDDANAGGVNIPTRVKTIINIIQGGDKNNQDNTPELNKCITYYQKKKLKKLLLRKGVVEYLEKRTDTNNLSDNKEYIKSIISHSDMDKLVKGQKVTWEHGTTYSRLESKKYVVENDKKHEWNVVTREKETPTSNKKNISCFYVWDDANDKLDVSSFLMTFFSNEQNENNESIIIYLKVDHNSDNVNIDNNEKLYEYRKKMYDKFINESKQFAESISKTYGISEEDKKYMYKNIIKKYKFGGFLPSTHNEERKHNFVTWDGKVLNKK